MAGTLYEMVGFNINLGEYGSEGRMMGLAGYGQPRFFDRDYVGNFYDYRHRGLNIQTWLRHCLRRGQAAGPTCSRWESESHLCSALMPTLPPAPKTF